MTDQPSTVRRAEIHAVTDNQHAPIIYFDAVPTCGSNAGIVNLTLSAARFLPAAGGVVTVDPTIVAHLRCTREAATLLRDLIDKALLIGAPAEGGAN